MRIQRIEFARLLTQVIRAVESRNTIPILGNVKLVNAGGTLTATATDLDIEITGSMPAEGDDAAFTVDAKILAGIVGKLSGDTVDMDLADSRVVVKSGRSRFTLDTLPVDDFPSFTAGTYTAEFDVDLAALVAPCAFAISTEETRFYLCGVYLHNDGGKLVAVATDGHRMSRNIGGDAPDMPSVILPRKTVGLLPKGTVKMAVGEAKVRLVGEGITIVSKVIDGTFPDYKRVIPAKNEKVVKVDGATLLVATERVSLVSSDRGRAVKLTCVDGKIVLAVEDKAVEDVDAALSDAIGREGFDIGFNAAYLSEVLRNVGGGEITMAMEPGGPAVITGKDEGLLCVLMPMRV